MVLTSKQMLIFLGEFSLVTYVAYAILLFLLAQLFHSTVYIPFKIYFLARYLPGVNLKTFGRWAVVTGATDGIGRGYAEALAKRGLDIILISRSENKLATVADDLENKWGVQVQTIAVDFTRTDIYNQLENSMQGLDIAILVNNVGMSCRPHTFLKAQNMLKLTTDLVNVNCVAMTIMCSLVLPQMLEKRKGAIVNISSMAANGFVGTTTYSSTKAYASMFSEMLQRTYRGSGVIIQTLEPGMVVTPMLVSALTDGLPIPSLNMARRYTSVSVHSYVEAAINTIGWSHKCQGHILHHIAYLATQLQPKASVDKIIMDDLSE